MPAILSSIFTPKLCFLIQEKIIYFCFLSKDNLMFFVL
ncbi:hypothetical protein LTSEHVI_4479 [Salmonella enterica subsp. enterica serovar Hvittingfoss str. A4-620]|nr:hypothetical protein LTSEHVI_4479 [Salmonella enterica subsp. enterica serovar Hvittingfoss str. A4-620]